MQVGKTSAAGVWGDPASFLHPIVGVPVPHDLSSPALAAAASADFHEAVSGGVVAIGFAASCQTGAGSTWASPQPRCWRLR